MSSNHIHVWMLSLLIYFKIKNFTMLRFFLKGLNHIYFCMSIMSLKHKPSFPRNNVKREEGGDSGRAGGWA